MLRNFACAFVLTFPAACATSTQPAPLPKELSAQIPQTKSSPIEYADLQLKQAGLTEEFIENLHKNFIDKNFIAKSHGKHHKKKKHKHHDAPAVASTTHDPSLPDWKESSEKIEELNVFGFLATSNYDLHDTPNAQNKIHQYLRDHRQSFQDEQKKYGVSSASIASLLWVETRHGKNMGSFPVAWVYYALVLGSHPDYVNKMLSLLPEKMAKGNPKTLTLQAAEEKVIDRCKSKAIWATEELKALEKIETDADFDPFKVKASFAGAFGISQFIPSTYLKMAVSDFRKTPDLFKDSDAILSVGHFLQGNGWKEDDNTSKTQALFSYNRSHDYGAVILKLASEVSTTKSDK